MGLAAHPWLEEGVEARHPHSVLLVGEEAEEGAGEGAELA